jgi:hypothetical protein
MERVITLVKGSLRKEKKYMSKKIYNKNQRN